MKITVVKNCLFPLVLLLFGLKFTSSAQVVELFISQYGEGSSNNKYLEIYNGTNATIHLSDYAFPHVSNEPTIAGEYEFWNRFPDGAEIGPGDVYVIAHASADPQILAQADHTHHLLSNGDDGYALVKGGTFNDLDNDGNYDAGEVTGYTILDWLGNWQGDPGAGWDVAGVAEATTNHTLTRKSSVCGPNNDWASSAGTSADDSEWVVSGIDTGWDAIGSFNGCISNPSISFTSPSNNQVFDASTTHVPVNITLSNFTLSSDDGSGNGNGSGDGYIKYSLQETGQAIQEAALFSTDLDDILVVSGRSYTLTLELVDNEGASFSVPVSATIHFSVEFSCDLILGSISTACDASSATTYSGAVDFTGGNTGVVYTITAPSGVSIGGDNPDITEQGTITFSNLPLGNDLSVTISGDASSGCDYDLTFPSPVCRVLPIDEAFDYTEGAHLSDAAIWSNLNSGDTIVVASGNLDYPGLTSSTGNSISFDGSGAEAFTQFTDVTSGSVYASFIFRVTAFQTNASPDLTDGGYFAGLASSTNTYDARLWVRPNPDTNGTTFDMGFGHELSNPTVTTDTYEIGDAIFVVMSYDIDNGQTNVWINPDASSFGNVPPTATISSIDNSAASKISTFIFRQDSDKETPFLQIDALRIDTSWSSVTPADGTASTESDRLSVFNAYPNPLRKGSRLIVTTASTKTKTITIFDMLGKKVFHQKFSSTKKTMDLSEMPSGVYWLKVTERSRTAVRKLIIE